ncbi:hypothetical protein SAMN02745244_02799 [Tessaracoccus bendigoensis DSM 12906]|uniref:Uncharacterized protein n=1 Tax=Tessaracoccus bendigoensis DSM 12906 TaxID=1123357 RepID=A0A1M6KEG2_9ACTN|nr:hypothetical protein [Tessaracoccus bendigoensis]SHJ57344.1 hypothetical protein SAMN02745244_02799 [Tessaracoccus bendigoensis DSM 12906]
MTTTAPARDRIVSSKAGQVPWAREAIAVLRETATVYGATITYPALAEEVQRRSGARTHAQQHTWLGGVLRLVATACHGRNLPPLTSLAVSAKDGAVGVGYDVVAQVSGLAPFTSPSERERHAAASRLACYRAFGAEVPEDAQPTPAPVKVVTASPQRRTQPLELRAPVCTGCFIELPLAGGGCPNCD